MIRTRAKNHLIDFCIATDPFYQPNWHHEEVAKKLEAVERGEIRRLMIFMPPRHGKSELATIRFPIWYLGRNSRKEIITASYSEELAKDFGSKARDMVNENPFEHIFGIKLRSDEKNKSKWKTDNGGSYTSVGVGGAITGRGANILIIDDPIKNREEAESEVYRDKVWNWYTSTARTRLEKDAAVIVILTRWHMDDLAGRLLNQAKDIGVKWEVVKYPAIALEDEKFRKQGDPLWNSKYDIKALNETKAEIGSYDWSALYQQQPILSENQEFKSHWIKTRTLEEVDRIMTRNFLTIDTAISKSASADYTGICKNFVDRDNNWNLWAYRMKINPKELVDLLFKLHNEDNYETIGIEKTIYFDAIKPFLDDEMRKRNMFLPIVPLEHRQTAKELRIRGLIPRYESRSIFHLEGKCKDLEEEMWQFPLGIHDDVLDATAYQTQIAEAPIQPNEENEILSNRDNYGYKD